MKCAMKKTIKRIVSCIIIMSLLPLGDFAYIRAERRTNAYATDGGKETKSRRWKITDNVVIEDTVKLEQNETVNSITINGTLDLNGYSLSVNSDVEVNGSILFHTGSMTCGGNLCFGEQAYCYFRDKEDCLTVNGDFTDKAYDRKDAIMLKNGSIHLKGNYDVKSGIRYSGCTMYFEGGNEQEIRSNSAFDKVIVNKTQGSALNIYVSDIYEEAYSSIENNSNTIINTFKITEDEYKVYKLTENTIIYDDLEIRERIYDLNGYTLEVAGDLNIYSGKIYVNGGMLIVGGYLTNTHGYIDMINDNDRIVVYGGVSLVENKWFKFKKGEFISKSWLNFDVEEISIDNTFYAEEMWQDCGKVNIGGKVYAEKFHWRNSFDNSVLNFDHGMMMVFEDFSIGGMQNCLVLNLYNADDRLYSYNGIHMSDILWDVNNNRGKVISVYGEGTDEKIMAFFDGEKEKYDKKMDYDPEKAYKKSALHNVLVNNALTEDVTICENLYTYDEDIDLNGHTLTVKGDVVSKVKNGNGKICVNGGKLVVEGDFIAENYGENINLTDDSDEIIVYGKYIGSGNQKINHGKIQIYGGINLNSAYDLKLENKAVLCIEGEYFKGIEAYYDDYELSISNLVVDCNEKLHTNIKIRVDNSIEVKNGRLDEIILGRNARIVNNQCH